MAQLIDEQIRIKHKNEVCQLVDTTIDIVEDCVYKYQFDHYKINITNKYNYLVERQLVDLSQTFGRCISTFELGLLYDVNVVEFYNWLMVCFCKIDFTENRLLLMRWLKKYMERERVVLDSLCFLRNQEKIKILVKWDPIRCNFDHHLLDLRCTHGNINHMKTSIARVMCSVHSTQISDYLNYVSKMLKDFEITKHLIICKNIRKEILSIKIDHDNDFREFSETFNIVSIIETSKGKTVMMVINDLLNEYDLLAMDDRNEAIIMINKVLEEIEKIDTYRFIEY
jgi:hypothetical protein